MDKLHRNARIGALVKILSDNPNRIFTFNEFSEMFGCAKSTLSEDIDILQNLMKRFSLGTIQTISGAAGGVKYISLLTKEQINQIISKLCHKLSNESRILSGGYIYMTDIIYDSKVVDDVGKIFAGQFIDNNIDYVVTVETKGIPIALMTAKYLNVPLVIVRRNSKVTEGSSVNINYVSASTRRIQTMSLSRRAIKKNSKVLFVDDFMKAGGTAKGIIELMKEFESTVEGIAVLISTKETKEKFAKDYFSLIELKQIDEYCNEIDLDSGIKLD